MQLGMLGTYLVVVGGTVLEIVTIAVLLELLPTGSHISGSIDEIVLSTEVVVIVGLVDASNIIQKLFERLTIAALIEEGRKGLVELMEGFDA